MTSPMRTQLKHMVLPLLAVMVACGLGDPVMMPVSCETLVSPPGEAVPADVDDLLVILLHIDSIPRSGEVLVRVDPLDEVGAVSFVTAPPPTAGAVSLATTTSGLFQGCFSEAPAGFVLRTPVAPRDKAWLRVSSDRTVSVRVETGEPGPAAVRASHLLTVEPGSSGRTSWRGSRR